MKASLASPPPALLEALGVTWSSTASGVAVSPEVALRCPAVSCAVRAIAEAVACLPVSVYRVGADGSREEATDHPVHALLAGQWNDWTGAYDGVHAGTVDALTNDAGGLIFVNRVNGAPRELIRLKPGAWSVDRDLATDEPTFRSADRVLPLADCINVAFDSWRTGGATDGAVSSVATTGTLDWLFAEYRADRRFTKLDPRTRRNHESGMRLVGGYVMKDGRRLGQVRLSAVTTAVTDTLYEKLLTVTETDAAGNVVERERRTTVNHAMKTCRRAWNVAARRNPGKPLARRSIPN